MAKGAPDHVLPVRVAVQVTGEEIVIIPLATTTATTDQESVGTSYNRLVDINPDRLTIIIINISTTDCWLGFTSAVSPTTGFLLAEGQVYSSDVYKGKIYAITESGTATLAIIEDTK